LTASEIHSAIAALDALRPGNLKFILLAGDVNSQAENSVPTFYRASTAMSQFGGDPTIASDNPYADLHGDDAPEVAIGRIPADSPEQLKSVLARVIAYEQQNDFSTWRRDVHVVAGVGGFGFMADSIIEMTTRRFLADRIPGWSDVSLTQASMQSHYCPDPWKFSEACLGRLNQGGMFWIYIGHGHVKTLDYMRVDDEYLPILTCDHLPAVNVGKRSPIAVFLACYTGAFDAREDSLAEQLILQPSGPIAAIAATRVSGPYGLAMLSDGLLSSCFEQQTGTLGEVVLLAKQNLLATEPTIRPASEPTSGAEASNAQLQMITAIAGALSPEGYDLIAERREHVWQMNLLGDPMLKLSHPQTIELAVPNRVIPGQPLIVTGQSGLPGRLVVEFAYRREHVRRELNGLETNISTALGRDRFQQRYQSANQRVIALREIEVTAAPFQVALTVPPELPGGKYCVRAFVEGAAGWQVGYEELLVREATHPSSSNASESSPDILR
jgi:hypothetical protein